MDGHNENLLEEEAAALMRQNQRTLRYWRAQGIGPRWAKLGRRIVYRRSDVQAWIDEQFEANAAS
jgi:hypothetical protein